MNKLTCVPYARRSISDTLLKGQETENVMQMCVEWFNFRAEEKIEGTILIPKL